MHPTRSPKATLRLLSAGLVAAAAGTVLIAGWAPLAAADHNGEKVEVSKTNDLQEGETVKVTFSGFTPGGKQAKAVIAGQGKLVTIPDKLNFDEYAVAPAVDVGADGTGSFDLVVVSDHGTVQDGTTLDCKTQQCWVIVVQEPFLPQPNYAAVPITFAGGSVAPTETTAVAAETTVVPFDPTVSTTTAAPAEESTTTAAATDATTTTVSDAATTSASGDDGDADDEGGSGALYAIIAGVVVVLGAGGFFIARRKPPVG